MKVLLIATVQSHICQFHKPLVELLHENGCVVHVAARNNLAEKNGLKLDFAEKVYDLPFSRSPKSPDNIKAYKQLKKIITENGYDVIHCNTPMGGIVTRLAAKKARKGGTKVFYTAHGFHFYKGAPLLNWMLYYPIEKIFANMTDKLITINEEDYRLAAAKISKRAFKINGVGVDEERFFPADEDEIVNLREKLKIPVDKKVILCIGELLRNKNHAMIINAMPKILKDKPDTVLLVAGNGPLREELEKLISDLGLENNIRLLGYVTNIEEYHRACDLLAACSIREGLPLNVIEAMMSAKPVVAADNRGHRELVKDDFNGYIVPQNDADQMSRRIISIFADDNKYSSMAQNARESSLKYGSKIVKEELRKIYEL